MLNNKKPDIRFIDYNDDWEQRKLKELASFSKGAGYTKSDLVNIGKPIILYGSLYTQYRTIIDEVCTFVEEKEKSVVSIGNEVIVPASGESAEDISRASVVAKAGIILGGDLNIIKPISKIDSSFLALNISNGRQQKELSKKAQGKSVVHLHNSDLKEIELVYPKQEEQTMIGLLFNQLDKTITLHQSELTKLKQFKQSMLQKMFPREGQTEPEIRFEGFGGEWKKITLGELGSLVSGVGFPESEQKGKKGIPFYKVSDMNLSVNTIKMINSNNYVSETQIIKRGWSPIQKVPAIVFAKVGAALLGNRKRMVEKEFLIDNNMMAFRVEKNDKYFIYYMFLTIYLPKYAQVGALPSFNSSDIAKIEVTIPSLSEQQIVGTFFRSLDKKINLQEQKLTKIKHFKQAMLQKMFV